MNERRRWNIRELQLLDDHGPHNTAEGMRKYIDRSEGGIAEQAKKRGVRLRGLIFKGPWSAAEVDGLQVLAYIGLTAVQINRIMPWRVVTNIIDQAEALGLTIVSGLPALPDVRNMPMWQESMRCLESLASHRLPLTQMAEALGVIELGVGYAKKHQWPRPSDRRAA